LAITLPRLYYNFQTPFSLTHPKENIKEKKQK